MPPDVERSAEDIKIYSCEGLWRMGDHTSIDPEGEPWTATPQAVQLNAVPCIGQELCAKCSNLKGEGGEGGGEEEE